MVDIDTFWSRGEECAGQVFLQMRGKAFRYVVAHGHVVPDTTFQQIPRSHFDRALGRWPFVNTVPLRDLRGPSYVWAILTDPRIRRGDW